MLNPSEPSVSTTQLGAPPTPPPALPPQQQRVWDLKGIGKTDSEIAAIMGISQNVVQKYVVLARKRLGLTHTAPANLSGIEHKNPEAAAIAIEAASDPWFKTLKQSIDNANDLLKKSGISSKISYALVKRLRMKYTGAVYAARNLQTGQILEMLGKKIDHCAFYLDDKVLAEASARDLMLGMTALVEKRQLLRGEPTQIISDLERKNLNELLPLAIAEAQRRGLTIPGTVIEKTVEPV